MAQKMMTRYTEERIEPGQDEASFVSANIRSAGDCCQEKIPAELRARNQWVACKMVPDYDNNGKLKPKSRKVPMDVRTERGAQANNPRTWSFIDDVMTFIDEWAGYDHTHVDGTGAEITGTVSEHPGFMFHSDDPFCGIDLDDCRNPDTGEVAPWAREIIEHFNSYTELSQSGTGFHILITGQKPAGSRSRKGGIECYDRDRYFICTGEVIHGIDTIEARQVELESFLEKHLSKKAPPKNGPLNGKSFSHVDDQKIRDLAQTVLDRALRSKNRAIIQALLNGKNAGQSSDSEADLVLCNHLVFFCGYASDDEVHQVVDQIFRGSKRMRGKWDTVHRPADSATYGQMTIEKAVGGTPKRYMTREQRIMADTNDVADILDRIGKTIDDVVNLSYEGQAGCRTLFIDVYRGRLCFDHAAGNWYEFQDHAWAQENLQKVIAECDIIKRIFERADGELGGQIIDLGQDMKNAEGPAERSTMISVIYNPPRTTIRIPEI